MPKIRNKKTGEIIEVSEQELGNYGINLPQAKDGKWIKKAINPAHKGFCSPMTKSTCTPKRRALAKTFKKHHGFHKEHGGMQYMDGESGSNMVRNPTEVFNYTTSQFTPPQNLQPLNTQMPDYQLDERKWATPTAPTGYEGMTEVKDLVPFTKPQINKKAPKLLPVTGDKYFNRGLTYLNQAIKHDSNINNPNPDMSPDYSGIMSPLQTFADGGGFNQNGFNNIMQGVAAGVNTIQSGINFGKGALDVLGTNIQNYGEQLNNTNQYTQSVFNDAMQTTPQDYIYNRNQLAENGKIIKQFGGNGEPNVEIENKEVAIHPSGYSKRFFGKTHAEGGIPASMSQGTKIGSEKLGLSFKEREELKKINLPKAEDGINITEVNDISNGLDFLNFIPNKNKKMSFADMISPFQTKKDFKRKEHKFADDIQKNTADIIINRKDYLGNQPFVLQENLKIGGHFGKDVQMNAIQDYKMEYGGIKKAQDGLFKTFNTKYNKKTETGVDVTTDPPTESDWQNTIIPSWYNYSEGNLPYLTDPKNQQFSGSIPKNLQTNEALLQETMYDSLLNRLDPKQNFTQAERDAALMQFKNMWGKTGRVTFNNKDKYKKPDINSWKAGDENTYKELANLRGNFIDSKLEKRFLLPVNKPNNFSQNLAKTENKNSQEPTIKTEYKFVDKPIANLPNVNIPLAFPNVYSRIPNNYYKINPEFIDPRYLNIQDQLNEINRGTRAFQSNLGSRGTSDISNLLQSQINANAAKNQVFGNKYNYDRQQDSQAQQFNAQAKMTTAQYNQNSWFNQHEDPIRRRESATGDQELTDINRGTDNYNRAIEFQNNLKYLQDTVPFYSKMTPEQAVAYAQMMLPGLNNPYADTKTIKTTDSTGKTKTTQTSQKYGGKIKLKPKLKKK